jgi:phenylpropionate dioxygenase-like ring-hydroxylating dioxygenase large terminal subunit
MQMPLDTETVAEHTSESEQDAVRRRHEEVLHNVRLELTRKIVAMARKGETHMAPDVLEVDVEFFRDPELYKREFKKLFLETPLMACLSTDIAEPGSFQIFEDVGVPIVVMRGKDGQVRAFLNVCPHRGARVVREDCGKARSFTCRFHGWTFDNTGQIIGLPNEAQFCGQIDDRKHMVAVPCEERHGIVFVQATAGSAMDLDKHLADFGPHLDALGLTQAHLVLKAQVESPSNWKYALDTYFENYHLPSLHKNTFANVFANDLCLLETWGRHQRFTFPQRSIHDWMNKPEAEWDVDSLPAQHFLFPNTVITLGSVSRSGSLISIHRIFPQSAGELINQVTMYAPHGLKSPDHKAEIERSFDAIMGAVRDEDYSVTGEAYYGIFALPEGTQFPVGRQEVGTQNFHRNVMSAMED